MDKIVKIEIMFKYKEHHLPSKCMNYEKYTLEDWLVAEAWYGFTRDVITNMHTNSTTVKWKMIDWKTMGTP